MESADPYAQGEVSVGRVVRCSRPAEPDRVSWWMWDAPVLRVHKVSPCGIRPPDEQQRQPAQQHAARVLYRSKTVSGSLTCWLSAADRLRRERWV